MTLVDAGPLIALVDTDDASHCACAKFAEACVPPLLTTFPAFTEAMYLLGRRAPSGQRWRWQQRLWALVDSGALTVHARDVDLLDRVQALMMKYQDLPMDLADASLVALAESIDQPRIFTLDRHFRIYKFRGRRGFDVVP
ncbi:MAG: PIN domain-containing protein [Phycisphaerales bacterium]|nr:PIN domain-containing protein [Phycisphaerales bacterium]